MSCAELAAGAARGAGGFSLIEALVASVVLAVVVIAVGASVSAGRQQSEEAEKGILAAIAVDDLMSELVTVPYAQLDSYDGVMQAEGGMTTLDGGAYPPSFSAIGRSVLVEDEVMTDQGLSLQINGKRIVIAAFDAKRVLAQLETFIPEGSQ